MYFIFCVTTLVGELKHIRDCDLILSELKILALVRRKTPSKVQLGKIIFPDLESMFTKNEN